MDKEHHYALHAVWTDSKGKGTVNARAYSRKHVIHINGKPDIELTTGNKLVGDAGVLDPEDLLMSAVSSCHMLSYLYLCSMEGVTVTRYEDHADGWMVEEASGAGQFRMITLRPEVTVTDQSMVEKAIALHEKAHHICYIARSVNFEIRCEPKCELT